MRRSEKFNEILSRVSDITDVRESEILSSARPIDVCMARQLFFLLCNEDGDMRPITIKRLCEDRGWTPPHSTITQNINRAKAAVESDGEFKMFLDEARRSI